MRTVPTRPVPPPDPVAAWLAGAAPADVGLLPGRPEGTARVYVRLAESLPAERVQELRQLGLDAEASMQLVPGSLTREQARTVLTVPGVVSVSPIGSSTPTASPTTQDPPEQECGDA